MYERRLLVSLCAKPADFPERPRASFCPVLDLPLRGARAVAAMVSVRIASARLAVFLLVLAQSRVIVANPRRLYQDISAAEEHSTPGPQEDVIPQAITRFRNFSTDCFVVGLGRRASVFSGGAACNGPRSHKLVGIAPSCAQVRLGTEQCVDEADGCLYQTVLDFRNSAEGPVNNFHIRRACNRASGPRGDPIVPCSSPAARCSGKCTVTNSFTGSYYVGQCVSPQLLPFGRILAGPSTAPANRGRCEFCSFPRLVNASFSQVQHCHVITVRGLERKIQCGPVTCAFATPVSLFNGLGPFPASYAMSKNADFFLNETRLFYDLFRITEFGSNIVFSGGVFGEDPNLGCRGAILRSTAFRCCGGLVTLDVAELGDPNDLASCWENLSRWIDQARTRDVRVFGCPGDQSCFRNPLCSLDQFNFFCHGCGLIKASPVFFRERSVAGVNLVLFRGRG